MKLARPAASAMLPLFMATCLLFQVSEGARPTSPTEPLGAAVFDAVRRDGAGTRGARPADTHMVGGDLLRAGAGSSAAPSGQGKARDFVVGSAAAAPGRRSELALARQPVVLRSQLARRFLATAAGVEAAGTDGAGTSCGSYSPRTHCPPSRR